MTPVAVKATFHNAVRESFNWLNIVTGTLIALMGAYFLSGGLATQTTIRIVLGIGLLVAGVAAAILHIRNMDKVAFELTDDAFRYQAGWRRLEFAWQDIDAARLDLSAKQLTFWVAGKPYRMHHYGITKAEFADAAAFIQAKLKEFNISQKTG